MPLNTAQVLIAAAVLGAAGVAVFQNNPAPASATASAAPAVAETPAEAFPQHTNEALPPNHPPVGQGSSRAGTASTHASADDFAPASEAPAVLTWSAPATWSSAPNPNSMRLATHKVPRAAGDTEDAELSVSRAGGDTEANVERWVDQLDARGKEQRLTKMVQGFKVTLVQVEGTYAGGMGASNTVRKNWALLGAIVETPPQSYFFKVTGPAATVRASRKAFDAMIDAIVAR